MLLEIERLKENGIGILKLAGVLDISTVEAFKESLDYVLNAQEVIIDFKKIKFIDSTGIGGIVSAIRKCREQRSSIRIKNISQEVFEIFEILGLPEIFGKEVFEVIP